MLISSPPELAGMTLEARLISYDWQNQFDEFQEATRSGSFKPLCWGAKNHVIPVSTYIEFLRTVVLETNNNLLKIHASEVCSFSNSTNQSININLI